MVTVAKTETPHSPEHGVLSGVSDTESNSGRDNEVKDYLCKCFQLSALL